MLNEQELYDEESEVEVLETSGKTYSKVEHKDVTIDTGTGQVIEDEKLGPWETMKLIAKQLNMPIQDPKKNCKKCYGRGYIGTVLETGQPIPCTCIWTKDSKIKDQMFQLRSSPNRTMRRRS